MQNGHPLIIEPSAKGHHFGGHSEELSLKSRIRRDKNMMWGHLNFEKKYAGTEKANLLAKETFKNCCGETILGLITLRLRKFITNAVKAKAAYSFIKGGAPWDRY